MAKKPTSIAQEDWDEAYNPVTCDPQAQLRHELQSVDFQQAYAACSEEYDTLGTVLKARKNANMTQEEVAKRMGTTKSAVSRLESSLMDNQHSPSLSTLRRYATALGYKLEISFTAQ